MHPVWFVYLSATIFFLLWLIVLPLCLCLLVRLACCLPGNKLNRSTAWSYSKSKLLLTLFVLPGFFSPCHSSLSTCSFFSLEPFAPLRTLPSRPTLAWLLRRSAFRLLPASSCLVLQRETNLLKLRMYNDSRYVCLHVLPDHSLYAFALLGVLSLPCFTCDLLAHEPCQLTQSFHLFLASSPFRLSPNDLSLTNH